MTIKKLQVL